MKIHQAAKSVVGVALISLVAGLGGGAARTAGETWSNDWLYYGLHRLILWKYAELSVNLTLAVAAFVLVLYLIRRLAGIRRGDPVRARLMFARLCGVVCGASALAYLGYQVNRYAVAGFWDWGGGKVLLGLRVNEHSDVAATTVLLWNAGAVLAGAAGGLAVFLLLRFVVARIESVFLARLGYRAGVAAVVLAAGLAGLFLAGSIRPSARHPNVLLISVDTLRADHLGSYGYAFATSPHIDNLAREGVLFENAIAQANWTLPSHASIMTSQVPSVHGVQSREQRIAKRKVLLAEVLKDHGYATIGLTGGYNVDGRFGFSQGFDEYHGDKVRHLAMEEKRKYGHGIRLSYVLPDVFEKLEGMGHRPWFLFLHFWDTHAPYMPHDGYIEMFSNGYDGDIDVLTHELTMRLHGNPDAASPKDIARIKALYDNEIRYVDQSLGRLFRWLKQQELFDNTIIVLTSDHGDEILEHGLMGHAKALYEPEIHVPLVLSYPPALPSGARVNDVVRSIDIVPTVLALAGIEVSPQVSHEFQGRSLLNSWNTELLPASATSEGNHGRMVALRTARHKYIHGKASETKPEKEELYDLQEDPGEQENVFETQTGIASDMKQTLEVYRRNMARIRSFGAAEKARVDDAFRRKLRDLGYLQ